jgi:hypothetical protein
MSPTADQLSRLLMGADPSRDLDPLDCTCGPDGHRLLAAYLDQPAEMVSDYEMKVPRPARLRLRAQGLAMLVDGREGGWSSGMWTVCLTAAGIAHAKALAGRTGEHCGPGVCGGRFDALGRCAACGVYERLTIDAARRRIEAMPSGEQREREQRASQFVCPTHGRARDAMVRTDKTCSICREGFIRDRPLLVSS